MFSFDFRKTSAWDYQRHLLRPWHTVTVTLHLDHDYVPCGPRLRWFWAIVPFDVDRDYAMWATITVKHKMRPTSQRNPGPHHNGISGPHPMESPAHIDRNTHKAQKIERLRLTFPSSRSIFFGEPSELNQTRFVWMEFSPNLDSRSPRSFRKRSASARCWKPKTRSSAYRTAITSPCAHCLRHLSNQRSKT